MVSRLRNKFRLSNKNKINNGNNKQSNKINKNTNKSKKIIKQSNKVNKSKKIIKQSNKVNKNTNESKKIIKQSNSVKLTKKVKKVINQNGGYNKEKTACAPYMVSKQNLFKGGKVLENGKKVEVVSTVHPDSCMSYDDLKLIISAWNESYPDEKIVKQNEKGLVKSENELWESLRDRIDKHIPDEGEYEWWEQDFVKNKLNKQQINEIKESNYAPEAPNSWKHKPDTWLSTLDIEEVLKQYEMKYPEFISYGATPIDFDLKDSIGECKVNDLCNIDVDKLISGDNCNNIDCNGKKIKYIGIVFNLDKHYESGSHWIALFVNIPLGEINYWDSYGYKPPSEVSDLMDKIKEQLEQSKLYNKINNSRKIKIQENSVRHQYKNSECGVYSLHFIIKQLEGKSFKEVCENKISDDEMNNYRMKYFTNAR